MDSTKLNQINVESNQEVTQSNIQGIDEMELKNNDRIIDVPFTYIKQSVGFKKNYPEVIEFINSIIFEAIEDGYIKNSLQKHNVDKKLSIPKSN